MKELEEEWAKLPGDPAVPSRFLRSQQQVLQTQALTPSPSVGAVGGAETFASPVPVVEAVDPYELIDPVDMLSSMPKDFFERVVRALLQSFVRFS